MSSGFCEVTELVGMRAWGRTWVRTWVFCLQIPSAPRHLRERPRSRACIWGSRYTRLSLRLREARTPSLPQRPRALLRFTWPFVSSLALADRAPCSPVNGDELEMQRAGGDGPQLPVESCFLGINKPECPLPQCREPPEMSGAARLGCVLPTCLFPTHMIPRDRLTAFLGPTVGSGGHSGTGVVTLEAPPSSAAATLAWVSMACVTLHRKRGEWLNSTTRKSRFQSFNPIKSSPAICGCFGKRKRKNV